MVLRQQLAELALLETFLCRSFFAAFEQLLKLDGVVGELLPQPGEVGQAENVEVLSFEGQRNPVDVLA